MERLKIENETNESSHLDSLFMIYLSSLDRSVSEDEDDDVEEEEFSCLRCDGFCTAGCELFDVLKNRFQIIVFRSIVI
jgi:heterodisulfide reductase subunit C